MYNKKSGYKGYPGRPMTDDCLCCQQESAKFLERIVSAAKSGRKTRSR